MAQKLSPDMFRSAFKAIDKDVVRWFPGHMGRGLKQMQHKLRSIDCIIEVHDARIPISGRNTDFKYTISGIKPHILVLNKVDLIDKKLIPSIKNRLKNEFENVVFTNCKDQQCKGVKTLFPLAQNLIKNSDRFNRSQAEDQCVMIIGVPNVGKSSLINALRVRNLHKGNATHVGATPGITRSVLTKIKMSEDPLCYMLDTPGILTPKIESAEVGLKLALCATIQDHLVGEGVIADYLLFWLNKNGHYNYVKFFGLEKATDDILEVLAQISVKKKKMLKLRDNTNNYVYKPDLDYGAKVMLQAFRKGDLGKIVLDEDLL
ncbi:mitochondrial GTPase 1 [Tribolium castaneum]|uniref:Mitochondrial GTPase 1 n=1 Tax=Tribolium castaneum TaxID=7070 RepID=D6WTA4_TRICA|nr:PREDICTED: mitochondrial GTPase 1 [Tribolium castaneum]EFA06687.1 Mitochondrial ribosome-associated GTPase 1-like Protein [Tribolium castaneum]|eukprot:XP_971754.1 PREDICTED: mitochondrial GTPase 1 [Tribolium castaneum]